MELQVSNIPGDTTGDAGLASLPLFLITTALTRLAVSPASTPFGLRGARLPSAANQALLGGKQQASGGNGMMSSPASFIALTLAERRPNGIPQSGMRQFQVSGVKKICEGHNTDQILHR